MSKRRGSPVVTLATIAGEVVGPCSCDYAISFPLVESRTILAFVPN
jgi:hypothetical protein